MCLGKFAQMFQGKSVTRCQESLARVFHERIARACRARCSDKSATVFLANSARTFLARVASRCRGNSVPTCRRRVATACRGRVASRCQSRAANKCQESSARLRCQCTLEASRRPLSGPLWIMGPSFCQPEYGPMVHPKALSDFTSSDRRSIGNVVLGGLHQ